VAYPAPTKGFRQTNPDTAMLFVLFACTHPPPPVPPFNSHTAYLPRTSLDMTSCIMELLHTCVIGTLVGKGLTSLYLDQQWDTLSICIR